MNNAQLVKDMEILLKPVNKCNHDFKIIQEVPFIIVECKKCEQQIHCKKKTYNWLMNLTKNELSKALTG